MKFVLVLFGANQKFVSWFVHVVVMNMSSVGSECNGCFEKSVSIHLGSV